MTRRIASHTGMRRPEELGALGLALLDAVATEPAGPARLAIVGFEGEALLLGRHQRAASTLSHAARESGLPVARRAGGGRALQVGAGQLALLLAVPRPDALLDAPIGADRLLNRYVRGLLTGLRRLGCPAAYFGRDFVSARREGERASRQVAVISQDGVPSGACLVEAIVAVGASPGLPASFSGQPVHADPRAYGPAWGTVLPEGGPPPSWPELAARLGAGFAETFGARLEEGGALPVAGASPALSVTEDEAGLGSSGVADVPIGFFEALARAADGRVAEARLRGDLVAPAFVLRELEQDLVGAPLAFDALGARVDEAFRRPFASVLGLSHLRVIADAVLAAAAP